MTDSDGPQTALLGTLDDHYEGDGVDERRLIKATDAATRFHVTTLMDALERLKRAGEVYETDGNIHPTGA